MGTVKPSEGTATKSWSGRLKNAIQSILGTQGDELEDQVVEEFQQFFHDGTVGEYDD